VAERRFKKSFLSHSRRRAPFLGRGGRRDLDLSLASPPHLLAYLLTIMRYIWYNIGVREEEMVDKISIICYNKGRK